MAQERIDLAYGDELDAMIDPGSGEMFAPRFDGEFLFRVTDASKLRAFVHTLGNGASEGEVLAAWLRGVVRVAVATALGALVMGAPILSLVEADVAPDVDAKLRDSLPSELAPVGLEFAGLGAFTFDIDDESRARITAARG